MQPGPVCSALSLFVSGPAPLPHFPPLLRVCLLYPRVQGGGVGRSPVQTRFSACCPHSLLRGLGTQRASEGASWDTTPASRRAARAGFPSRRSGVRRPRARTAEAHPHPPWRLRPQPRAGRGLPPEAPPLGVQVSVSFPRPRGLSLCAGLCPSPSYRDTGQTGAGPVISFHLRYALNAPAPELSRSEVLGVRT